MTDTIGNAELVRRLRYRVGNPSAWETFDNGASELMREAAAALEATASPKAAVTDAMISGEPFYAEEMGAYIEDPWVQVGYFKEKLRQAESEAAAWRERAMALRLSPARGEAAVKALEWVDTGQTGFLETRYYAVAGSLRHTVHPVANEDGSFFEHYGVRYDRHDDTWKLTYWVGNNGLSGITGKYKKLEAAKAAAQADFERRIRSALVSAKPAPATKPEPGFHTELSEETKAELKAIDDNIRAAKIAAPGIIVGGPVPATGGE